jgi:hypothetical protein
MTSGGGAAARRNGRLELPNEVSARSMMNSAERAK